MAVEQASEVKAKHLVIRVVDHSKPGDPVVRIRVPVGVVKFGLKMGQAFSPEMKRADVNWDEVLNLIAAGELGDLVHVEDEAEHKTIDVSVE